MSHPAVYGLVYVLTSPNNKVYVGQTTQGFRKRWKQHIYNADVRRDNFYLYNAINKYGADSFKKKEVFFAFDKEGLDFCEKALIALYNADNPEYGYNIREGGSRGKLSEETRHKISISRMGKYTGEENPNFGKHHTEEAKEKIRQAHLGGHHSEEARNKMSLTRSGENNGMFGKQHSEESKLKNRLSNLGQKRTKETRKKMSDAAWLRHHFKEIAWG